MIKRVIDAKEKNLIYSRQQRGRMTQLFDEEGYTCYDEEEFENWKPKKIGRKPIRR